MLKLFVLMLVPYVSFANPFVKNVCKTTPKGVLCWSFTNHPTWRQVSNKDVRYERLLKKVNRTNHRPNSPMLLPIPRKPELFYAPKELRCGCAAKEVFVSLKPSTLAFIACKNGRVVKWGPAMGGRGWCPDIHRRCRTPAGKYKVLITKGPYYRSPKYPIGCKLKQCARMPWFIKFRATGEGLHGSNDLPGWNASHGCVRLLESDARWLNQKFVDKQTIITVLPY